MEKYKQILIIVGAVLVALFLGTVLLKVLGFLISIGFYLTVIIVGYILIKKLFVNENDEDQNDPRRYL